MMVSLGKLVCLEGDLFNVQHILNNLVNYEHRRI